MSPDVLTGFNTKMLSSKFLICAYIQEKRFLEKPDQKC